MAQKKLFWLKLHKDFFKGKEIKKLRRIAGGDTFVIIYLKMQLLSIATDGYIEYEQVEDTFAKEIALELDEDQGNVEATIMFLEQMGMLKEVENGTFRIPHVVDLIGKETPQARSMRNKRAKEKQLLTNNNVTMLHDGYAHVTGSEKNVTLEREKDTEKDTDTEIEREKERERKSAHSLVIPSNDVVEELSRAIISNWNMQTGSKAKYSIDFHGIIKMVLSESSREEVGETLLKTFEILSNEKYYPTSLPSLRNYFLGSTELCFKSISEKPVDSYLKFENNLPKDTY